MINMVNSRPGVATLPKATCGMKQTVVRSGQVLRSSRKTGLSLFADGALQGSNSRVNEGRGHSNDTPCYSPEEMKPNACPVALPQGDVAYSRVRVSRKNGGGPQLFVSAFCTGVPFRLCSA